MALLKYFSLKKKRTSGDPFVIQTGRFGETKARSVYRPIWAEDTYISESNKNQEVIGQNFNVNYLFVIAIFFILLLSLLLGKVAWLQVVKGDYYRSMAEGNRIRITRIEPQRGVILDRSGNTLVRNKPNFLLYFVPVDLPSGEELDEMIAEVEKIVGSISGDEIKTKLATINKKSLDAYQPLFIEDNIEYEKAMKLYLKSAEWPGVVLSSKSNREYNYITNPSNSSVAASQDDFGKYSISLSHVMGYTGKINEKNYRNTATNICQLIILGKWELNIFGKTN